MESLSAITVMLESLNQRNLIPQRESARLQDRFNVSVSACLICAELGGEPAGGVRHVDSLVAALISRD